MVGAEEHQPVSTRHPHARLGCHSLSGEELKLLIRRLDLVWHTDDGRPVGTHFTCFRESAGLVPCYWPHSCVNVDECCDCSYLILLIRACLRRTVRVLPHDGMHFVASHSHIKSLGGRH